MATDDEVDELAGLLIRALELSGHLDNAQLHSLLRLAVFELGRIISQRTNVSDILQRRD